MRFFPDDLSTQTPVEWYYVPDDRPAVPYGHPFGSADWDKRGDPRLLGEVPGTATYYAGDHAQELLGLGICGSKEQWENGPSILDDVRPINPTTGRQCCCGRGALPMEESMVMGFDAGLLQPEMVVCPTVGKVPKYFRLQVAPAGNLDCLDCPNVFSTYTLTIDPGALANACQWKSPEFTLCGTPRRWYLRSPFDAFPWQVFCAPGVVNLRMVTYQKSTPFLPWAFGNIMLRGSFYEGCLWPVAVNCNFLWSHP